MAVTFNGSIPPFAQGSSLHSAALAINATPGRTDSPFNRPSLLAVPSSTPDRLSTPPSHQRRPTPQDNSFAIVQAPAGYDWNNVSAFTPAQSTRPPAQQPHSTQRNIHVTGVFSEPSPILDFLLLGSDESASDYERIRPLGVTHVLNMARECPNHFEGRFVYLRADFQDFAFEDMMDFLPRGILFIEEARTAKPAQGSKRKHGVVLVHCNQGRSRSASMVIAYIMWKLGQTLDDAQAVVQAQRPHIETYNFGHHLREFERLLNESDHFVMARNCEINALPFEPQPITEIFAHRRPRPPNYPPPAAPFNAGALDSRPPASVPGLDRPPPMNPFAADDADGLDLNSFGFNQGRAADMSQFGFNQQPPAAHAAFAHAPELPGPYNQDLVAFSFGPNHVQEVDLASFGFNQQPNNQFLYNVAQPPPLLVLPTIKKKTPSSSTASATANSPPTDVVVITPMQPPEEEEARPPAKPSPRKETPKEKPAASTSTATPLLGEKPTLLVTPELPLRLSTTPREAAATPAETTPVGEVRITPELPPIQIVERTTPHASPRRTPLHPSVEIVQPPKQCCIIS